MNNKNENKMGRRGFAKVWSMSALAPAIKASSGKATAAGSKPESALGKKLVACGAPHSDMRGVAA
jgi:hypothetical protein